MKPRKSKKDKDDESSININDNNIKCPYCGERINRSIYLNRGIKNRGITSALLWSTSGILFWSKRVQIKYNTCYTCGVEWTIEP